MNVTAEQVQAINILINSVNVAQKRGAYSLKEAQVIQSAIDLLVTKEELNSEDVSDDDADVVDSEEETED